MLIVPPIGWKVASGGGGGDGYSFNMTAGDYFGLILGYFPDLNIGSIDAEPIPGTTLVLCISDPFGSLVGAPSSAMQFAGDITSIVAGLEVWIDGVPVTLTFPWTYDSEGDTTLCGFGDGTEFTDGNTYFIEIK